MDYVNIISGIENLIRNNLRGHDTGHDWWHIDRVRRMALRIVREEGSGDPAITEISSLLHEIYDKKFSGAGQKALLKKVNRMLPETGLSRNDIDSIQFIIQNISFSKGYSGEGIAPEFAAVQDADRLDALGAIGIARAFNYGGYAGNPLYDPAPGGRSTIAHFHDKLLKLKELMNTSAGKKMAEERHAFVVEFLNRFMDEWQQSG